MLCITGWEELAALSDQELLYTPYGREEDAAPFWLSNTEIIAWPVDGGEPLTLSMIK